MSKEIPVHVGIIMDGNGRWAKQRGLSRDEGHKEGARRSKDIIVASIDAGIKVLTLYAFSSENWKRPQNEISTLMELLYEYLRSELPNILSKGVKFRVIGNHEKLPITIKLLLKHYQSISAKNTGMHLILALSYGGHDEIIRTIRRLAQKGTDMKNITEEEFEENLDTAGLPPVDLIIRTSGEERLSNFLIWQAAYAELYFTKTLWPDFNKEEFNTAITDFTNRERRFGAV